MPCSAPMATQVWVGEFQLQRTQLNLVIARECMFCGLRLALRYVDLRLCGSGTSGLICNP